MKKSVRNIIEFALSALISFFLVLRIFDSFIIAFPFRSAAFYAVILILLFLIKRSIKVKNKKIAAVSGVFSAVISVSFVIGEKIDVLSAVPFEKFNCGDIINWITLSLFFFFVVINLLDFICSHSCKLSAKKTGFKMWLIIFAIIVVCWIPYLLIYYPGNLSNDSLDILEQLNGMPLSNHHPVMYTLFVGVFYKFGLMFGDANFAIACFSFVQLLMTAAVLSYCVYWFAEKGAHQYVLILITAYFALNPVIAMYAITMWKDILFSCWVLLFILLLYDIVKSNGSLLKTRKGLSFIIILCFLISFGRNNGIYIVTASLIVLGIIYREHIKKILPAFMSTVIIILVIQGPIYKSLNISKTTFAESVGIPLQQIGYTVKYGGEITEEQKEFINQIIPEDIMSSVYQPYCADFIKFNNYFNNAFLEENKIRFLEIWAEILPQNCTDYLKAYLMQTLGYYHIGTSDWICQFGVVEGGPPNYFNTDYFGKTLNVNLQSYISRLIGNPHRSKLYSIAFTVWLTFFNCAVMVIKKQAKYIMPLIPLIALWGTMMVAAPTFCEFRYMYSFQLALPFLVTTLFISPGQSELKANVRHKSIDSDKNIESR